MPGQKIIDENNPDDRCMYLIVDGLAKVVKNHQEINQLKTGAVCGEINVLGLAAKRTATIIAEQTCYLQVLHQSVVVRGLELFPEERKKVLMMAFKGHALNQAQVQAQAKDVPTRTRRSALAMSAELSRGSIKELPADAAPMTHRSSVRALDNCRPRMSRMSIKAMSTDSPSSTRQSIARQSVLELRQQSPGTFPTTEGLQEKDEDGRMRSKTIVNRAIMAQALQGSPLFADVGTNFIEELALVATDRIYMPGDMIIEQGKKGDSMFVMVSGAAAVYATESGSNKAKVGTGFSDDEPLTMDGYGNMVKPRSYVSRVGSLTGGSVGGELAMLGVSQTRSATIEAETICSMWEIAQEEALPIIERFPDAMKHFANIIVEHLERTVPTRILSIPLFRGFDRKFRTLLGIYSERRAYFPGQTIVREGALGERLYIMNLGRVRLEKKNVNVKMYASGTHFGSTVMLGIHKAYVGTLIALQTCHLLAVTRTAYQAALEQYPALGAAQEMCRSEKANEEVLREAVQRSATRKLIWKRYQLLCMDPAHMVNPFAASKTNQSDQETLERYCQAWRSLAKYQRERRETLKRDKLKQREVMESWLQRRAEAMERARQRRQEEQMDDMPDYLRGGLDGNEGRAETETVKLPLVPLPPGEAERRDLAAYLQDWPAPRPSPHYRLRLYGVLKEAVVSSPTEVSPLLPLLNESKASFKLGSNKAAANVLFLEEDTDGPSVGFLGKAPHSIKDDHLLSGRTPGQDVAELSSDALQTEDEEGGHEWDESGEQEEVQEHGTPSPSEGATPLPNSCTAEGSNLKLPPIHSEEYPQYCMTPPMSASSMISGASGRGILL